MPLASYDPPKLSHSSFLRRILATLDCSSSSRDPSWFWNKKNIPRSWLFRNPASSSVRPRASSLAPATRPSAMTEVVQPVDIAPPPVNALVRVRNPPDATPPPSRWQLRRVVVETRASSISEKCHPSRGVSPRPPPSLAPPTDPAARPEPTVRRSSPRANSPSSSTTSPSRRTPRIARTTASAASSSTSPHPTSSPCRTSR